MKTLAAVDKCTNGEGLEISGVHKEPQAFVRCLLHCDGVGYVSPFAKR